jgi:hypothetical protein
MWPVVEKEASLESESGDEGDPLPLTLGDFRGDTL